MLNENRIKTMTKMAMYETTDGESDMKINSYYKRDYVSFNVLLSCLWMTLGYLIIVGGGLLVFLDEILDNFSLNYLMMIVISILIVYFVLLLVYIIGAHTFYQKKYVAAKARMKAFNHNLTKLNRMYEKEKE